MIDIIYRYDPATHESGASPATPAEARQRLCNGNREFIGLVELPTDNGHATRVIPFNLGDFGVCEVEGGTPRQQPFAVVLGCSDARAPTELIFHQACNSLFVVRVAGNVLGNECLGSIDYAVQHLGHKLKLIVVLGHSGCGAVTAAVDTFLDPARYLAVANSQALRSIIDGLLVAVCAAAAALKTVHGPDVLLMPGYRAGLVEISIALNAAMTAKTLQYEFRESETARFEVVYGVYHLVSREVDLPSGVLDDGQPNLYDPPADEDGFRQLGVQLAGCKEITRLLANRQR